MVGACVTQIQERDLDLKCVPVLITLSVLIKLIEEITLLMEENEFIRMTSRLEPS